jgi:hypothetical protein
MTSPNLYVVYLGGDLVEGRMGEDHEVVVVVGDDVKDARRKAKTKWGGHGNAHIDAVQRIDRVDGYDLALQAGSTPGDQIVLDPAYEASDPT